MDSYAVLDTTMLHELFHTPTGRRRGDIDDAYGWQTCVDMSHDKSINNAGELNPPSITIVYGVLNRRRQLYVLCFGRQDDQESGEVSSKFGFGTIAESVTEFETKARWNS